MSHSDFVRRVQESGGASMELGSGRLLQPGQRGYMVGGEADRHGGMIPSWNVPASEFGEEHVAKFVDYMRGTVGSTFRTNVGAWRDGDEVVMDASRKVPRAGEAIRKGRKRNQLAVWDNRRMREIGTGGSGVSR